jgi:hypothetical protein
VTAKVEGLYGAAPTLPADAEGSAMARLRREHHRMLGNGYCTQAGGARLRLRGDLRGLHLLRHHHRVQADSRAPARGRNEQEPGRPSDDLPQPSRRPRAVRVLSPSGFDLTAITCIMPGVRAADPAGVGPETRGSVVAGLAIVRPYRPPRHVCATSPIPWATIRVSIIERAAAWHRRLPRWLDRPCVACVDV